MSSPRLRFIFLEELHSLYSLLMGCKVFSPQNTPAPELSARECLKKWICVQEIIKTPNFSFFGKSVIVEGKTTPLSLLEWIQPPISVIWAH